MVAGRPHPGSDRVTPLVSDELPPALAALDARLVEIAGRFGDVLGGQRPPRAGEHDELTAAYTGIDAACAAWARGQQKGPADVRAGQVLGTAALLSIHCREVLGLMGPAPFTGELDPPPTGVVGGHAGMHTVDDATPWLGGRWLIVSDDGRRLPATLEMLLQDSSGVDREASEREHRAALKGVTKAARADVPDPMAASGALDWLLFDWLMAHRESGTSAAIEISAGRLDDAAMIVWAVAASVTLRETFDPALAAALRSGTSA